MGNLTSSPFSNLHPLPADPGEQNSFLIMTPTPPNPASQKAILSYFSHSPQNTKPYEILPSALSSYPQDHPSSNLTFKSSVVEIQDVRGREEGFKLDVQGFCFLRCQTRVRDLKDEKEVEGTYIPEIETLLRKELGGKVRVCVFGWKLRSSAETGTGCERASIGPPTRHPHVDQSPVGAARRVRFHLPDEAEQLLRGRVRIINVWRPLKKVTAWPLALCDARSVDPGDLVPKQRIGKAFTGESYLARFSERHQWCYLEGMEREEVVVMKIFDSWEKRGDGDGDGEGVDCCLHCSFELQGKEWSGVRESIEVRAMVFDELGMEDGVDGEVEGGWVLVDRL